ncbi:MAG: hypothetical protein M3032_10025 [Verrucomicrobiota bacterium]|nr:hypothetical protein [Verrucomicrobiota bacterium]
MNSGDATYVRSRAGLAVDGNTFRSDVNTNGFIESADATISRARSGNALAYKN